MRDAIDGEIRKAVAEDVFSLFTGALTAEAGITLDQTAVNAVNAQLGN
jgi:peptidyl-prolyl cis-trans isomerase D